MAMKNNYTKKPLITTGANGLVGSKFVQLFQDKYQIKSLELRHPTHPVDITNLNAVLSAFEQSAAESVIHLAAFTNVSAAWEQQGNKDGLVYQVNVGGTQNIIKACQQYNKHLIHISTAYVFDGEKDSQYTESDRPHPIEWYGQTKWEAEQAVMESDIDWTILRIDQPFRSDPNEKTDVAHRIVQGLQKQSLPPMFTDHYFGPTYIEDFGRVLDFFATSKTTGLFHATSGEKWSDYQFAQEIKQAHDLRGKIKKGTLDEYLKTLQRPYQRNTSLECSKLKKVLGFELTTIKQALESLQV